jgi:hypothetical protein
MSPHDELTLRIRIIEKQIQFWKRFSLALAVVVGVSFLVGMKSGPEDIVCNMISCKGILIGEKDGPGTTYIESGMILIKDKDRKDRIALGDFTGKNGGYGVGVVLDEVGKRGVWMGVQKNDVPFFLLYGRDGRTPNVMITRDVPGSPRAGGAITVADDQQNVLFDVPNR